MDGGLNMASIDNTPTSPRVENNTLYWYEGDSFTITWILTLLKDNITYIYQPTDKLVFGFYDRTPNHKKIHEFEFTNIPSTNTVVLEFSNAVSNKFKAGHYYYCIKIIRENGARITTIGAKHMVEVQKCH